MFQTLHKETVFLWEANMCKGANTELNIEDTENQNLPWKSK